MLVHPESKHSETVLHLPKRSGHSEVWIPLYLCPLSLLSQGPRILSPHSQSESVFSKECELLVNLRVNKSYYLYNTSCASKCYLFESLQWPPRTGMLISLSISSLYFALSFFLPPGVWLSMNHINGLPWPLVSTWVWPVGSTSRIEEGERRGSSRHVPPHTLTSSPLDQGWTASMFHLEGGNSCCVALSYSYSCSSLFL